MTVTHDPMCPSVDVRQSGMPVIDLCNCDLIRRVREDCDSQGLGKQYDSELSWWDGYRRGVEDAAQAVEAVEPDNLFWIGRRSAVAAIRALVKEES